jgi:hypothetical protein
MKRSSQDERRERGLLGHNPVGLSATSGSISGCVSAASASGNRTHRPIASASMSSREGTSEDVAVAHTPANATSGPLLSLTNASRSASPVEVVRLVRGGLKVRSPRSTRQKNVQAVARVVVVA